MADPLLTRYRTQPPATVTERLRAAALDFRARWRLATPRPSGGMRHLEAAGILVVFVSIVIVGYVLDEPGALWPKSLSSGMLTGFFEPVTALGASGYIFALSAITTVAAILARGRGASRSNDAALGLLAGRAAFVFAATALSGLLSQLIKHLFGRARPSLFEIVGPYHFDTFAFTSRYASFPSGHTVTAFTLALALGWFMPRLRWPLLGLAALIGVSRVAVGAHYPSDALAGALLGVGATIALRKAFASRRIVFRPLGHFIAARRARSALGAIKWIRIGKV